MGNEYFENALMQNADTWYEKYRAEKRKVKQAKDIIKEYVDYPTSNDELWKLHEKAERFLKETTKNEK